MKTEKLFTFYSGVMDCLWALQPHKNLKGNESAWDDINKDVSQKHDSILKKFIHWPGCFTFKIDNFCSFWDKSSYTAKKWFPILSNALKPFSR